MPKQIRDIKFMISPISQAPDNISPEIQGKVYLIWRQIVKDFLDESGFHFKSIQEQQISAKRTEQQNSTKRN
jgi:hypothetical protein